MPAAAPVLTPTAQALTQVLGATVRAQRKALRVSVTALAEAKAGLAGRVHTPEQIAARRRGRPAGSVAAVTKEPVKLRLDPPIEIEYYQAGGILPYVLTQLLA